MLLSEKCNFWQGDTSNIQLETTQDMIQNNCVMRKLNVHLVVIANKPLLVHLKCCD